MLLIKDLEVVAWDFEHIDPPGDDSLPPSDRVGPRLLAT